MADFWFKFEPQSWLNATRTLTPEERAVLLDVRCLVMARAAPVPNEKWLAFHLHVSLRLCRAIVARLIEAGHLERTETGLTNRAWEAAIALRKQEQATNKRIAIEREASRRETNANWGFARAENGLGEFSNVSGEREKANPFNETCARVVSRSQHASSASSESQSEIEKETEEKYDQADIRRALTDPKASDQREIAAATLWRLYGDQIVSAVGQAKGERIVWQYSKSRYARNARNLPAAFRGWLKNTYNVAVILPGKDFTRADALPLVGIDERGQPNLKLPTAKALADWSARQRARDSKDVSSDVSDKKDGD